MKIYQFSPKPIYFSFFYYFFISITYPKIKFFFFKKFC